MKKIKFYIPILLLVIFLTSGCSLKENKDQTLDPTSDKKNELFTLYSSDYKTQWLINGLGESIPKDEAFTFIYDLVSNKPMAKVYLKSKTTDQFDEYGNTIVENWSALYDLKDNLIIDWEEAIYSDGFGDFVVKSNKKYNFFTDLKPDDFKSQLINLKSKEVAYEEVFNVKYLGAGSDLVLLNSDFQPIGVVNIQGEKVSGFPFPPEFRSVEEVWNGYLIVNNYGYDSPESQDERWVYLVDKNLNPLIKKFYITSGNSKKYLHFYDGVDDYSFVKGGLIALDGQEVLRVDDGDLIKYFDDDLAIVQKNTLDQDQNPDRENSLKPKYDLINLKNSKVLAKDYDSISLSSSNENLISENFLAYKDDRFFLLNREGEPILTKDFPDLTDINPINTNTYVIEKLVNDTTRAGVLGSNLEILIPFSKYSSIYGSLGWNIDQKSENNIIISSYEEDGVYLMDIYNDKGEIIVESISELYRVGYSGFAIKKGFSFGLMDYDGKWIVKESVFSKGLMD